MNTQDISYLHSSDLIPLQEKFILHQHHQYHELIFLLRGNVTYYVEGTSYPLNPYDIVIACNNELHQLVPNAPSPYERITVKISANFFEKYHCSELHKIFTERRLGQNNRIPHSLHGAYSIIPLFQKIDYYLEDGNEIAALCVFIEILTLINKVSDRNTPMVNKQKNINEIINYIHDHRTEPITLSSIANHFYLNKQYLCRIFKQSTGYTVNEYINLKRCLLANELIQQGKLKTTAALEAGFANYSTYYRVSKGCLGIHDNVSV